MFVAVNVEEWVKPRPSDSDVLSVPPTTDAEKNLRLLRPLAVSILRTPKQVQAAGDIYMEKWSTEFELVVRSRFPHYFDDLPQPEWPQGVTLDELLAVPEV